MIQDRGRLKWSSFTLPEHKKMIAKMYEAEHDVKQPVIDEQRLEELQAATVHAMSKNRTVRITYHENKRFKEAVGTIAKVDQLTGMIHLDAAGRPLRIPLLAITDLQTIEDSMLFIID
ncbi:YolD-like family protein [Paenibacillus abyssi]|uniref:YolD-like family protein n=1 Tax=Paenibacillus abyssi TaxID=1340531 RepID=A0A917G1W8_9BACL|nr:YolD-like family protein [Paenibacillus abyssi]GGG17666.1 hypothetical protein GCM10010916_38130 [Paenibacillus abyssi]